MMMTDGRRKSECMGFEYYYSGEGEQYVFYRIPKALFTSEKYRSVSTDAKVLYGLMLDRLALSEKNGWCDEEGRLYIYYTLEDIEQSLFVGHQKAAQIMKELADAELIRKKRQGLGRPNRVYLGRFLEVRNSYFKKYENHTSASMEIILPEVRKSYSNNTENNKINKNKIDSILFRDEGKRIDFSYPETDPFQREELEAYFESICSFSQLKEEYPEMEDEIEEIRGLILETVLSRKKKIRICGEMKEAETVKSCFMKLNIEHIRFVLNSLMENTAEVHSVKQYLLASLYNAPFTISNYYRAKTNHQFYSCGDSS